MSFCYEEWQPYAYVDENKENTGITVNYLKRKLTVANIRYQFTELPFPRCREAVLSGQLDFILHIDDTDNFQMLDHAISHWQLTFAVSMNSTLTFDDIINSQGLKVLMARSYNYPLTLEDKLRSMAAKTIKVSFYTSEIVALKRLFHRLTVGQGDAMVVDKIWAQKVIEQHQLPIKLFDQIVVSVPQFIGYNRGNEQKAQRLSLALAENK